MKTLRLTLAIGAAVACAPALASGPLYLWEGGEQPVPYRWNTDNGPIPVWTDGGEAFAFDFDGVTPFLTIERANEITEYAFGQWNAVSTSTFEAHVAGTIESVTGIADVTGANAGDIYDQENGYGFFVNYDTDGSILSDYFGVGTSVLGIAFPEWADEATGEITEATAVINGIAIWENDTNGDEIAGVFTHEFGHAINLSHSQTNGDLFFAQSVYNRQAGPRNCGPYPARSSFEEIETMYPFLTIYQVGPGQAMSTINLPDDKAGISNLYPSEDYLATTGTITGVLRLKDGQTEYSGINVVARNVNDWYGDAVSAMTGDQTQGLVGPDGRFTLNGLTPGESYVVYITDIWQGGFPTTPQPIVSQGEYWNVAESNDPEVDEICDFTPIVAQAGNPQVADITFNGYNDGIQYTPIVSAFLTDMAKNGKASAGIAGNTAFKWEASHGFKVMPAPITGGNPSINRNGQVLTVQYDFDGNGIGQAALFDFSGNSLSGDLVNLGDLNGDTCGGTGQAGINSSYAWDIDAAGHTVVGTAYVDNDGNGTCGTTSKEEIIPFIWTKGRNGGMRPLSITGHPSSSWIRAQAVSGNGKVVLGNNGGSRAVAWVNEGPLVNLYAGAYRARDAYAVSHDGSKVALDTFDNGPVLWNPFEDSYTEIGSLQWCIDVPYVNFRYGDLCAPPVTPRPICPTGCTPEELAALLGPVSVLPTDMNDEGTVIIGRAGSFQLGYVGALYVEGLGWMSLKTLFQKQGVAEALDFPMDNPISIDGKGNKLVGGLAGAQFSWYVDLSKVFVCDNGTDVQTPFPEGTVAAINNGAEFGRCAFID